MVDTSTNRERWGWGLLWVILAAVLALHVGWAVTRPTSDEQLQGLPDQLEYLQLARNLVSGNGYSFIDARLGAKVLAFRTPGYPLFLAACRANVRVIQVVQAVIATSMVLAIFLLAQLLGRPIDPGGGGARVAPSEARRMGWIAAVLVGFSPILVYFGGLILSETVFAAMLLWGMVLLIVGYGSTSGRARVIPWLGGGILLALSTLVRPSGIGLAVLLGIAAAFVNRPGRGAYQEGRSAMRLRWPLPIGATMLCLTVLALLPWAIRNRGLLHSWVWLDTNAGYTFYDGYNPDATGASDQKFVKYMPQLRQMDELNRSKYLRNLAIDYARAHPRHVLELAAAKFVRTWSPMPLSEQFSQRKYQLVGLLYSLPFDLLVLWGLAAGNLSRSAKVYVLLPAIYLSGIHMLTVGSLRYRLPAEAPLAILAASALAQVNSGRRLHAAIEVS